MLLAHVGFSIGLIALVAGVSLFLWSLRAEPGPGIVLGKSVGIIVIILAVLQLLCSVYAGIRYKDKDCKSKHCQCPVTKDQNAQTMTDTNQNVSSTPSDQSQNTNNTNNNSDSNYNSTNNPAPTTNP